MKRPTSPCYTTFQMNGQLPVQRQFERASVLQCGNIQAGSVQSNISRKRFRLPGLSLLVPGISLLALTVLLTSFSILYSIDDVATAMRAGNAGEISKYFDSRVDLTFPDKGSNYSKSQAEMILKDFFATNQVKGFVVKHKGENKDGSQFCIGVLQTKVRDYRTRFYLKKKGEQQYLQEIAFEVHE